MESWAWAGGLWAQDPGPGTQGPIGAGQGPLTPGPLGLQSEACLKWPRSEGWLNGFVGPNRAQINALLPVNAHPPYFGLCP